MSYTLTTSLPEGEHIVGLSVADELKNSTTKTWSFTVDTIRPAQITDLQAVAVTSNSVKLAWTATGDDDTTGGATTYDIRYSKREITADNRDTDLWI